MKLFVVILTIVLVAGSRLVSGQSLTPAQQAELDKATREAKAEMERAFNPEYILKAIDEQIEEARKNGATPAQIRALQQAKADAIQQLRARQQEATKPALVEPETSGSEQASESVVAALDKRLSRRDSGDVPVLYDPIPGRYSAVPTAFRVYTQWKLTPDEFVVFMQKKMGVTLRETGRYGLGKTQSRRYEQLHHGHPIRLAHYSISLDTNGYVIRANGDLFTPKQAATSSKTPEQLLTALRQVTQLPTLTLRNPAQPALPFAQALPLMWVHPNLIPGREPPVLCRPFTVGTQNSRRRYYLNAQTGALVAGENLRRTCRFIDEPIPFKVTVQTFHHNKRVVGVTRGKNGRHPGIFLVDSTESPAVIITRRDSEPVFSHDTTLQEATLRGRGDWDALFGFRQAARYFKGLGLNSYDNQGTPILAESCSEANAYWQSDEGKFYFGMVKGKPFANLHTVGHEFTHAVTEHTAGLIFQGESGALDESLADIFGVCIEHQAIGGNWLVDEEITAGGFRDMANPPAKGHPDTYLEFPWKPTDVPKDDGNVHSNSGVGNKWFYLLIKGGKGQNALKHPFDVFPTLAYNTVARVLLAALPRLSPRSGYEDLCRETIEAATQLHGECSPTTEAIKRAWYAVGVLEDPPAACKPGWTMDMVIGKQANRMLLNLYFKGDSAVMVYRGPEASTKLFTRRDSPITTAVVKDEDGVRSHNFPKDWSGFMGQQLEETMPMQEAAINEALTKARAELNDPNTPADRRAELRKTIPMVEKQLKAGQQTRNELQGQLAETQQVGQPQSELAFWGSRQARRDFDKKHIKATDMYQGKYLSRKYVLGGGAAGMYWWTTSQIPLRFSDLSLTSPMAPTLQMRSGVDHWLRGFPIQVHEMFQIQNIRESAPANFDALFSAAPVFQ
ncbi:hypothetical protein F5984_23370 [Rudanella paleaurantiibacter]|uniref:M4 family peptidase n=1 Tax=Rudanella paleaurantiibacter TaxID=2614655 RepID=A0A7J5TT91_9BACT|nr:M4 family metallopeptidase [Rudanella paleaurantiibacter]KAB7726857.1 hypothetical protein F5984_23370 [Rudanella paleaurantiibacter]